MIEQGRQEIPLKMKKSGVLSLLLALGCGLFLAGCSSVTPADVARTVGLYRSVGPGMNKEQVVAMLGAPQRVTSRGVFHWQTWSPKNDRAATLDVEFDANGWVRQIYSKVGGQREGLLPALRVVEVRTQDGRMEEVILPYTASSTPAPGSAGSGPDWTK